MRIISGRARGRILKSPRGTATRPTSDRTRESLFNILAARPFGQARILDIFAGTGALGLEAMSRGAAEGVFIDIRTGNLIRENAALCGFSRACTVLSMNHQRALASLQGRTFDYIFADPPYDNDLVNETLAAVFAYRLLAPDGLCVVEHSGREDIEAGGAFTIVREKAYGRETRMTFLVNRREGE